MSHNKDNNLYNYNISLEKYNLLKKIDSNLLSYTIEEIFEIGYTNYVRNFIKKSFEQNIESNEITEKITNSSNKGSYGENIVYDIIVNKFNDLQIEDTSKKPHHGDINLTFSSKNKTILEVKNYNKTVDIEQIDKLKYDMKYSKINCAILLSLNSGIVGKKKFELETFHIDGVLSFILYMPYSFHKSIPNKKNIIIHNSFEESVNNLTIKLEFAISIIENILNTTNQYKSFENSFHIKNSDIITEQLNTIYEEFKTIKKSYQKLEENIIRNLNTHSSTIKDFEFSIKKKINSLISQKIITSKIILEPYVKNNYDNHDNYDNFNIRYNNKICGKIICCNNIYSVFINQKINGIYYNKQFTNLEIAKLNIENYFNNL